MAIVHHILYHLRRFWDVLSKVFSRVREWLPNLVPGLCARRGAVIGSIGAVLLLMGYSGVLILRTGWGAVFDISIGVVIGALLIGVSTLGIMLCLAILSKLPRVFTGFIVGSIIAVMMLLQAPPDVALPLAAGIVIGSALMGGSIAVVTASNFRSSRWPKKVAIVALLLFSVGTAVWFFVWVGSPGTEEGLVKVEEGSRAPDILSAPDPSQPGSHQVQTLSYGSGDDRRDEFGKNARLKTHSVDGKAFVNKLGGWMSAIRKNYWGFDRRKLPLNGRVWCPSGDGPFPIVLVVHGNHNMREYSDPGYTYLGELLASRGCIVVSVDENFLNGDWTDNYDTENDARGWLLLEHLRTWREWNSDSTNQFYRKVDFDHIALMGHSRGGEAVAVAVAFNRLALYPDDARVKLGYGFNIRSVVAIAPIDGQYSPAGQSTPLSNINYLLLQGSHDADLFFFSGDRQYKRIKFSGDAYYFKTSLYIYRANHGQFNTVWGNRDYGLPGGYLLNTKPLLSGEEQRRIARVYISAFLEVTLKGNDAYLPLFRDYRKGSAWLPKTYYVSRFEDSRTRIVADFEEDIDVTSTTVPGGSIRGENLSNWREKDLGLRGVDSKRQNQVVLLGWQYDVKDTTSTGKEGVKSGDGDRGVLHGIRAATYSVSLPGDSVLRWKITSRSALVFSIAEIDEKPAKPDSLDNSDDMPRPDTAVGTTKQEEMSGAKGNSKEGRKKEREEKSEKKDGEVAKSIDFSIELVDARRESAALPLSQVMTLLPPLKSRFTRYEPWEKRYGGAAEAVLQTVEIPLLQFRTVNKKIDMRSLRVIRFRFDRSKEGVLVFDEIGFRSNRES
jgi:dienelactone hydrolase